MANRDNDDIARSGRPRRAAEDDESYVPRRVSREPAEETRRGEEFFDVEEVGLRDGERAAHAAGSPLYDRSAGFGRTLVRTTLGSIIPGLGLIGTRRTFLGLLLFSLSIIAGGTVAILAFIHRSTLVTILANANRLLIIAFALLIGGLLWVIVIVGTYLVSRPRRMTRVQRLVGAGVVFLMSFLVATPTAVASAYALQTSIVLNNIFDSGSRSQTRPELSGDNPWAAMDRLNILLVGADSGENRDAELGIRADTLMLASIDTRTGDTVIIQLPRNLENVPFPEGTALAEAYPEGRIWDGYSGSEDEYLLNAVWSEVPKEHPELFADTDFPGADATKMAVQGITGLEVNYFMMVNIDGIQALIDAMGGVTVNINFPIAKGGHVDGYGDEECGVDGHLTVGPDQTLNGNDAMWYARSRCNDPDYDYGRMRRQSCLVNAIIKQVNPQTLITRYEAIAAASENMVSTDIPQELLDDLANLALVVKDGAVSRLLISQDLSGAGGSGALEVNPAHPDYDEIRAAVADAIALSKNGGVAPETSTPAPTQATSEAAEPGEEGTWGDEGPGYGEDTTSASSATTSATAENVADACAYNPVG
ncbi:LCP family protein [Propionibacterium australiense]|nr:LCP family protein [Propionibacterium australiense]SYZ33087.1 lytR_cpsA_psr: cell envelope-related function transcriptional attenuator common domain [Propionibacterium australiense]VEH89094.1 Biofilm regulatory protein A precursor [Propionibacterium australiense]